MKNIKFLGGLTVVFALLTFSAAPTKLFDAVPPSAGKAYVCLPANVWVELVNGQKSRLAQNKRHEIPAGEHELSLGYKLGINVGGKVITEKAAAVRFIGLFEEGRTYYMVPNITYADPDSPSISFELVEITEQPLNQIIVPKYKPSSFNTLNYSPDGSRLLINFGNSLSIYTVAGGALEWTLGHSAEVMSGVWSSDGSRIMSVDTGGTIKLWDTATGVVIKNIRGKKGDIVIRTTPDSTKFLGKNDGINLKIWDMESGAELASIPNISGSSFMVSPDGQFVAGAFSDDWTIRVYEIGGGEPIYRFGERSARYYPVEFNDSNTLIAQKIETGSLTPKYVSINLRTLQIREISAPAVPAAKISYSNDDGKGFALIVSRLAKSSFGFMFMTDNETNNTESVFSSPLVDISAFSVSPTEMKIVTISRDGKIRFWNI